MATKSKVRTTIELNSEFDKTRLRMIAEDLGLIQTTGPHKGEGSISQLMQNIASGHLRVIGFPNHG